MAGTAMGNGMTFCLRPPTVEYYRTPHDAAYDPGDGATGSGFTFRALDALAN